MLSVTVHVDGQSDRHLTTRTADEMFLEIAALHAHLTARGVRGSCVAQTDGADTRDKAEYAALFAMGLPPLA